MSLTHVRGYNSMSTVRSVICTCVFNGVSMGRSGLRPTKKVMKTRQAGRVESIF